MALLAVFVALQSMNSPRSISPPEAEVLLRTDTSALVLDVRTMGEFLSPTGHLRGAIHIPVEEIEDRVGELAPFAGRTLVVYCRSGRRSRNAASFLEGRGFVAYNLEGGILEWNALSLPVVHGNQPE
jgi:rhodanese-related sulfurtransferase